MKVLLGIINKLPIINTKAIEILMQKIDNTNNNKIKIINDWSY